MAICSDFFFLILNEHAHDVVNGMKGYDVCVQPSILSPLYVLTCRIAGYLRGVQLSRMSSI